MCVCVSGSMKCWFFEKLCERVKQMIPYFDGMSSKNSSKLSLKNVHLNNIQIKQLLLKILFRVIFYVMKSLFTFDLPFLGFVDISSEGKKTSMIRILT